MAVIAPQVAAKFPSSIRRASAELVVRIGARRYAIAESRDRDRATVLDPLAAEQLEEHYRVMLMTDRREE